MQPVIDGHRNLISKFLQCATPALAQNGVVLIASKMGCDKQQQKVYASWGIPYHAAMCGLRHIGTFLKFDANDFPGYTPRMAHTRKRQMFPVDDAGVHVMIKEK